MSPEPSRPQRLSRERIVLFSTADWDTALPTNKHHVARRLAKRNRVLFVETLGTRAPRAGGADLSRVARRLRRGLEGAVRREPRLWTVSPLVRPRWSTATDVAVNRALFAAGAGRAIERFAPTIAWVYSPYAVHLLGATPRGGGPLLVYHMVDDLSAVPGADAASIREAERRLLARADLVFCTERTLYERASAITKRAHFLPNVADFAHFGEPRAASDAGRELAARIASLRGPRVLFSGQLASHKVDLDLLRDLARARPAWSFILVGPVWEADPRAEEFRALAQLPNVTMTGLVPYADLPVVLHAADVLLIPYARTAATEAVFPLKLFEYFATGKPVVSSAAMASLRPWAQVLALVPNRADRWAAAIERCLSEPADFPGQRRELARRNTWDTRLEHMELLIREARSRAR